MLILSETRLPATWPYIKPPTGGLKFESLKLSYAMEASATALPRFKDIFSDSDGENDFEGFLFNGDSSDESDLDVEGLESDDEREEMAVDDEQLGESWSETLADFDIEAFTAPSGPTFVVPDDPKALDFFSRLFGDDLIGRIVEETNKYARKKLEDSSRSHWQDVTLAEMKAFLGVTVVMGINRLPELELFWSSDEFFGNRGIQTVFTRDRFKAISRFLHFNNPDEEPSLEDPHRDRLYKVRPIIDYLLGTFQASYNPHQNISVDEGMIGFRGRISFRQYMPNKPQKYGFKVWMAADPTNGYVVNFDVYLGRKAGFQREYGLGYDVVTTLVRPYLNKNHHIYFDNFFSSVKLFDDLLKKKTYACGTVRTNRKGLLPCAGRKLRAQGETLRRQRGNLLFTKWHDKRDVTLLSTNCSPTAPDVQVLRPKRKDGEQVYTSKPYVVSLYNDNMLGVDRSDQMRSYYPVGRSSLKWYRYIFWYLVEVSICNAFALKRELVNDDRRPNFLGFRKDLARQLIAGYASRTTLCKRAKPAQIEMTPENASRHLIGKINGRKRQCVHCKIIGNSTPKGYPKETKFQCVQCSVALCQGQCFTNYHS